MLTKYVCKKLILVILFAYAGIAHAVCVGSASNLITVDSDSDGIPDPLESLEGKEFCVKDNEVVSNNNFFIKQVYRDFFGREFDVQGATYWSDFLAGGAQTRAGMIQTFMDSGEFQSKVAPITRLYKAYFKRMPDHEGLWYWVGLFGNGKNMADISQTFSDSPEFKAAYGSLANSAFIDLVYQNVLGRAADAAGKAYWLGLLNAGTQTRGEIMIGFSESAEHVSESTNHVGLILAYEGLLRRNISQEEYVAEMTKLRAGASISDLITKLILPSNHEYTRRFLSVPPTKTQQFTKIDRLGHILPDSAISWACVRDNITGLTWEGKTNDDGLHDKDKLYSYNYTIRTNDYRNNVKDFIFSVNQEKLCGVGNWRLPTEEEAFSMLDKTFVSPTINVTYFKNIVQNDYWLYFPSYWSDLFDSSFNFYTGIHDYPYREWWDTPTSKSAILVRDNFIRSPSFVKMDATGAELPDNASSWACAKDKLTGLIWENKTNDGGLHDKDNVYIYLHTPGQIIEGKTDAADFVTKVNSNGWCGATDWRIPSASELYGMVEQSDRRRYFPNIGTSAYWTTSTVSFWETSGKYTTDTVVVDFNNGAVHTVTPYIEAAPYGSVHGSPVRIVAFNPVILVRSKAEWKYGDRHYKYFD